MSTLEFVVILAASPIVAALVYGAWKFSSEPDVEASSSSKPAGKVGRYRNLKRALSA